MTEEKQKTRVIGRYPLRKRIGQGAMGSVYLAHDEMIDRDVAIKAIRLGKKRTPEERKKAVSNFFSEARMIGKLSHPHITAVYDMGIHGQTPYLVMEYLHGVTLEDMIRKGDPTTVEDKVSLMAMICQAIHYVHRHGILHRDIKPSNIMINKENLTPKIMDFGVAKTSPNHKGDLSDWVVENESLVGTPYYMSPEQVLGHELTPRADVFSLGVVFYEWLSGVKPFQGTKIVDVLKAIIEVKPVPLHETCPVSPELSAILHKALRKRSSKRYGSAAELADALVIYRESLDQKSTEDSLDVTMGARQNISDFRKQYPFFYDFTDKELFEIFQMATPETYEEGETIIHEGRTGNRMYFIVEGRVQVQKKMAGSSVVMKELEAGESMGEMAFINNAPRTASVVTMERTHVMALNEAVLRHNNPTLCLKLLRSLAVQISERLHATDQKYVKLLEGITRLTTETGGILDQ